MSIALDSPALVRPTLDATITSKEGRTATVRSRLVRSEYREGQVVVALKFVERTGEQHRRLIELMFSAPDSWHVAHGLEMKSSEHLWRIAQSIRRVYSRRRTLRRLAPRFPYHFAVSVRAQDDHEVAGHVIDMSHSGTRVRVRAQSGWSEGDDVQLLVTWNEYERSTLRARITNVTAAGDDALLGLAFTSLTRQQENDIFKHLYPATADAPARKAAA
jgi:hypothetical protein